MSISALATGNQEALVPHQGRSQTATWVVLHMASIYTTCANQPATQQIRLPGIGVICVCFWLWSVNPLHKTLQVSALDISLMVISICGGGCSSGRTQLACGQQLTSWMASLHGKNEHLLSRMQPPAAGQTKAFMHLYSHSVCKRADRMKGGHKRGAGIL